MFDIVDEKQKPANAEVPANVYSHNCIFGKSFPVSANPRYLKANIFSFRQGKFGSEDK